MASNLRTYGGGLPSFQKGGRFQKRRPGAPAGFFEAEAAGLRWLAEARAVPVVEVLDVDEDCLTLTQLLPVTPTLDHAREFGIALAGMHDASAPAYGWAPVDRAWFGPLEQPFEVPVRTRRTFSDYWAGDRLALVADLAASHFDASGWAKVKAAVAAVAEGAFEGISGGPAEPPARVHGDLWAGNVLWTREGAVLIDPAAHAGHRLEDLAMLGLFGAPHLAEILRGYEQAHPMPECWRQDLPAHLFFGLLAHVHLFGAGYVGQAVEVAEQVVRRAEQLGG